MNQVNLAVADLRYQKSESTASTKDVKDGKDAFKSYLEERYETKDSSKQPSDKKENNLIGDDSRQTGMPAEAALLMLQMGEILPDSLGLKVMPEGMTQAVPTMLPETGEISREVPALHAGIIEQPQTETVVKAEGEGLFAEKGQESELVLEGVELTDTEEAVDVKLLETQNATTEEAVAEEDISVSEERPVQIKETNAVVQTAQNDEAIPVEQIEVADAGRETNVKEYNVTERIHVSKPEEVPQKLTEELAVKVSKGVKEFEIQLEPRNLGKIAIKVLYDQGQTMISILCTEKKTLELIGQNAREIGHVMEQNLGDTTTIYVDKQENDQPYYSGGDQDHTGRDSEQERQREEQHKNQTDDSQQFIQKFRLGLTE